MKGWVYIFTNKAMPRLLKVGFSTKDPESRAKELHTTGVPHRFVVEYDILVHEPYVVEQKTHKLLKAHHESKEWFRCDITTAINAIRQAANSSIIHETIKNEVAIKILNIGSPLEAQAQFDLGELYANAECEARDIKKAIDWYRKAAEQGLQNAQNYLGYAYTNGQGVPKDVSKGMEWFRKATKQDEAKNDQNKIVTTTSLVDKLTEIKTYKLGDILSDGGIVYFLDDSNRHGIGAQPRNESNRLTWEEGKILANAYGQDWHLPTKEELALLYAKRNIVGRFPNNYYWSSTEVGSGNAWYQSFGNGYQYNNDKTNTFLVRAVRGF